MERIENLFEAERYDAKNITNKGYKCISEEVLKDIETNGATLEKLRDLQTPVYKYKTQITIHGLFPEVSGGYLGGYKSIIQNKNKSIGVKWNAIDHDKKTRIYKYIKEVLKYSVQRNSTEFFVYKKTDYIKNKEQYTELLEAEKNNLATIDKSLFYGNFGVFLSRDYFGQFLVSYINIGGIYEANIPAAVFNITGKTVEEIETAIQERETAEKLKWEQYKEEQKKQQEERDAAAAILIQPVKEEILKICDLKKGEIYNGLVVYTLQPNTERGEVIIKATKYTRTEREKKFRKQESYTTIDKLKEVEFHSSRWDVSKNQFSGYVLKSEEKPLPIKQDIQVVQYSDKCMAIFGDTRPIKEKLKAIGGKFNPYLTHNGERTPGWILPTTKREQITNLI